MKSRVRKAQRFFAGEDEGVTDALGVGAAARAGIAEQNLVGAIAAQRVVNIQQAFEETGALANPGMKSVPIGQRAGDLYRDFDEIDRARRENVFEAGKEAKARQAHMEGVQQKKDAGAAIRAAGRIVEEARRIGGGLHKQADTFRQNSRAMRLTR